MSQMIASDLNNPDFVGATNPDRGLAVKFYPRAVQNEFESEKQGRPIFYDVDFVKIFVPGDDTNVVDTAVREDHKQRFPLQWAHYKNQREGDQLTAGRTPLTEWTRLTLAQIEQLRGLRFYSVEDIAHASDMQLQSVGMVAGTSPFAFREAAQRFLQIAAKEAKESEATARIKQLEEDHARERDESKAQLQALQDQIAALVAASKQAAEVPEVSTKTKAK